MGKLTKEVFNESCCDGGSCSDTPHQSSQSCGCDPGIGHQCSQHKLKSLQDQLEHLERVNLVLEARINDLEDQLHLRRFLV